MFSLFSKNNLCFLFNINNVKKIKLRLAYLRYVLSRNVFKKEIDISPGVTEIFTRRGGEVVFSRSLSTDKNHKTNRGKLCLFIYLTIKSTDLQACMVN